MSGAAQDAAQSGTGACGTGLLVLTIMAIIAVVSSDNSDVSVACGDGLRKIVMAHIIIYFLIGILLACVVPCFRIGFGDRILWLAILAVLFLLGIFISWCVMAAYAYTLSADALANAECVSALKRNSTGINSAMLAFLGFTYFGIDLVVIVSAFWGMCVWGMCSACTSGQSHPNVGEMLRNANLAPNR